MTGKRKQLLIVMISILIIVAVLAVILWSKMMKPSDNSWRIFDSSLGNKEKVIDAVIEGNQAYLITNKSGHTKYGDSLMILTRNETNHWARTYENDFKNLKPWKIKLADVDGDKEKEIITAVRKTTHFDKTVKNRLFVFNYMDGKLVKKWTGSQIAGEWEDFAVGDFAPTDGNEIVFIRRTERGERVSVYYWVHFGFLMLAESKDYKDISNIFVTGKNQIHMKLRYNGKKRLIILEAKDGKLTEAVDSRSRVMSWLLP